MKKLFTILLTIFCLLNLSACSNNKIGLANPKVEYNSLDEINEKCNTNLVQLFNTGIISETFFVIDEKIAEYNFSLNGIDYTLRGSKITDQDISGIYGEDGVIFKDLSNPYDIYDGKENKAFRFVVDDTQYTLVASNCEQLDIDHFIDIASQMSNLVTGFNSETNNINETDLIGSYQDSVSKRAQAQISLNDDGTCSILISWPDTSEQWDEWEIRATLNNNKLEYNEIRHIKYMSDEEGNVNPIDVNDALPGYFEIKDSKLYWTGSNVENTSSCIFEKVSD